MICGFYYKTALILDIASMQMIKTIRINSDVGGLKKGRNVSIMFEHLRYPIIPAHILPETDKNFMLELNESRFIYLRNIDTGSKKILIEGSTS